MIKFTENDVELATIEWLEELGFDYGFGGDIFPRKRRDTLLPRLISGELRVDNVSEFVGMYKDKYCTRCFAN